MFSAPFRTARTFKSSQRCSTLETRSTPYPKLRRLDVSSVPEARCILHLHPPYATALATLADPKSSEESLYARVGVLLGLKSVVHSEVDLIERLEKGLGVAAVQSLRTRIGLTDAETFELIAPRRTLSRREGDMARR